MPVIGFPFTVTVLLPRKIRPTVRFLSRRYFPIASVSFFIRAAYHHILLGIMDDPSYMEVGSFEARYRALLETISTLRPALHRYCARMTGSVIDGEDIVQEALLKAVEAFPRAGPLVAA